MDENRFKIEKLEEQMKRHEDDGSSLQQQSAGIRASIVAAPVTVAVAAPASAHQTQHSEPRSPSPSSKKRNAGISQEQLTQIYDTINSVQQNLVTKLTEVDKLRSGLSKEVKELQKQLAQKASKDSIIDGQ